MKKITKLIMLSAICGLSYFASAQIPTNGLVAWYPFNGNANDQSGNGNNGTVNGATLTTDRFGNTNSAYSFDAVNDNIEVNDNTTLRLNNTDFTISAWVYEIDRDNTQHQAILSKRGTVSNSGWLFYIDVLSIPMGKSGFCISNFPDPTAYSSTAIPLLNWTHIVYKYTKANQTMYTYINGVLNNTTTSIPQPTLSNTNNMRIGSDIAANQYFFNGKLDDILIYNRALTNAEINQVYNNDCVSDITTGLVANFPFNGNANDASLNTNNATVSGATLTSDRFGNSNSAYYFDGIDNYIEIPHISAYNNQLYSISFWTKFSTAATPGSGGFNVNPALISKLAPSIITTYDNWVFYEGNGTPGFAYGATGNGSGSTSLFNDNNWHNIICTVNSDSVRFYFDGVLSDKVLKGSDLTFNNQPIRIGRSIATYWKAFNGVIDDLRIYNRALSTCDVDSLYNETPCVTPSQAATPTGAIQLCINAANTTYTTTGATNATAYIWAISPVGAGIITGTTTTAVVDWNNTYTGTVTICVKGTNGTGCEGTYSNNLIVTINPLPNVSFTGLSANYCENAAAVTLTGTPSGGTFSGNGISGNIFTPASANIGSNAIIYTASTNGCQNSSTQNTTMHANPTVSFSGLSATYKSTDAPATLTGSPVGGVFSGDGISGNIFTPSIAGIGSHNIVYIYTDGNGCANATCQTTDLSTLVNENKNPNNTINIFPNPNNGTFQVNFNVQRNENVIIEVYNNIGQKVYIESKNNSNGIYSKTIDLSGMPKGIYLMNTKIGGDSFTNKVTIQ